MNEVKVRFPKYPFSWLRWALGILGILGLWDHLTTIMTSINTGLLVNNTFLMFFAILGLWLCFMFYIYRKKTTLYSRILWIMCLLSLGLFIFSWLSGSISLVNKNIVVYAYLLLDLILIAWMVDPQFLHDKKNTRK